jgi:hypothetical protein
MSRDSVFAQFSKASPLPVMARIAIEHATGDEFLDRLVAENADRQVQGDLLFSTLVKRMAVVACRVRPGVNAAWPTRSANGVQASGIRGLFPRTTANRSLRMTHNDAKMTQTILVQLVAKPRLADVCRGRVNSRFTQYDAKPCNRLHSNDHVDLEVNGVPTGGVQ